MLRLFNLRLFDESGGEGGQSPAAEGAQSTEGSSVEQIDPQSPEMTYEEFIKAHKDEDDKRIQSIVKDRLKGHKELQTQYEKANGILSLVAKKYKVDAGNLDSLQQAIETDDSLYEEEAMARNVSIETVRLEKALEKERQVNQQMKQEQEQQEIIRGWVADGEKVKAVYPDFDFKTEIQNPVFGRLIAIPGLSMQQAYEAIHPDVRDKAIASDVSSKITGSIAAKGARPSENGANSQAGAKISTNVNNLTDAEIDEYLARARRGEQISFR